MKRKLKVTLEYVEEWNPEDEEDLEVKYEDYTFEDWQDCDWDNVGRPLDRMVDVGWVITKTEIN